jgi:7-cyano-7-deazaguanine synthase
MASQSTNTQTCRLLMTALVLLSGGQDSAVCLAWALREFEYVETVGFDYGQRHRVELDCRKEIIRHLCPGTIDHLIKIDLISDSYLTGGTSGTFVPARNIIFFSYAAALAWKLGITDIVGGMCRTDDAGYPDCRKSTIAAMQLTLRLGMDREFILHTPLIDMDKRAIWSLGRYLGISELIEEHTNTCYNGDRRKRHPWGYGCGECQSCLLRSRGYT